MPIAAVMTVFTMIGPMTLSWESVLIFSSAGDFEFWVVMIFASFFLSSKMRNRAKIDTKRYTMTEKSIIGAGKPDDGQPAISRQAKYMGNCLVIAAGRGLDRAVTGVAVSCG